MKLLSKLAVLVLALSLLVCASGLSVSAAGVGDPLWIANVEGYDKTAEDPLGTTGFYYPFAGGDSFLFVADASDPYTADYVIEGRYSMYFLNVGDDAVGDISAMITAQPADSPANFQEGKTYIARFLMKQLAPFSKGAYLWVIVRTWDWIDPWVVFEFTDDGEGGLQVKVTENQKMYEKAAIQKIDEDLYEVSLRFSGVPMNPANVTNEYLFWYLFGEGGFSIDDVKIYESSAAPNKAFEFEPMSSGGDPTNPPTTQAATTTKDGSGATTTKGGSNATTTKGGSDATTTKGGSNATTTKGGSNVTTKGDTVTTKGDTVTTKGDTNQTEAPTQPAATDGQPTEEQPTEEQPTEEQPTEEQPTEEQPTEEQPTEEQPTEAPTEAAPTEAAPTEAQPTEPVGGDTVSSDGLSGGALAAIIAGGVVVLGGGGYLISRLLAKKKA